MPPSRFNALFYLEIFFQTPEKFFIFRAVGQVVGNRGFLVENGYVDPVFIKQGIVYQVRLARVKRRQCGGGDERFVALLLLRHSAGTGQRSCPHRQT